MRTTETVPKEVLTCDGCDYLIGLTQEEYNDGRIIEEVIATLIIPWEAAINEILEFHFHVVPHRQDCFRYWAHNPRIMRRSLKARSMQEDEINKFMEIFIYRSENWNSAPGITRSGKTQKESYFEDGVA